MASLSLVFDLLARDRASSEFRKVGDAAERAGKSGTNFGSSISGAMKVAAGAFAAVGFGRLFGGFIEDAQESAKISRLTAQVIKTTGGAAHITAGQVGELATALSNKTAIDDEAIQSAENLLLTFTNVRNEAGRGNDIFNQTTQAALDMSTALGTDANGAAIQLGKALNDPIKGITALSRAGVSFTQEQKDQIRTLVESGDILGAQKIILAEVGREFSGAAAAAASPLDRLKVIAGNLGEQIGGALLPAAGKFAGFLSDKLIPGVRGLFDLLVHGDFTSEFAQVFGVAEDSGFVDFLFNVREAAIAAFDYVKGTVIPALADFGSWVVKNRDWIVPLVAALGAGLVVFKAITLATKAWAAAQAVLNVILAANPIGIVITILAALAAGLFVVYQKSETFRAIVDNAFKVIGAVATWLWDNILKPVFTFIGAAFQALAAGIGLAWNNVIKPTWNAISTVATWLWNNILAPIFSAIGTAWDALGTGLNWVYTHLIKPVFDLFKDIVGTVRDSFSTAVDTIKRVWDTLVDALKAPVQVVIDFVWNNGLRKLWNVINNIWDGDDIAPFRLASGGVLPGYTPGRDVHRFFSATGGILDLSGGEAVMRPEFTRALGKPTIDYLNRVARTQGEAGVAAAMGRQAFAGGGTVSLGDRSVSWAENLGLSALPFVSPLGYNLIKPITDYIRKEATTTQDQGSSPWYSALGDMFRTGANKLWTTIKDEVSSWFSDESGKRRATGGTFGGTDGVGVSVGPVADIVRSVANSYGWGAGAEWAALSWIINRESGWRPTAQNPTSTAYGLFQFLDGTWGGTGIGKTSDPRLQSIAGMRYISSRYRDPIGAQQFWARNGWYDNGGLLPPGLTMAYNGTGKPETIRTAEQEAALKRPIVVYAQFGTETIEARTVRVVDQALGDVHDRALYAGGN